MEGGLPVVLSEGFVGSGWSSWSERNEIVSVLNFAGLSRIPAAGGAPQFVPGTKPFAPSFLPGGELILQSTGPLSIVPIEGGKPKPIRGITAKWAQYVPAGYILYIDRSNVLQALPFDTIRLEATGSPFPLVENVDSFDISTNGIFVCHRGKPISRTVQWVDESGKTEPIIGAPGPYNDPRLSPDGTRLAVAIRDGQAMQIWIHDLARHSANRVTFGDSSSTDPKWMPDGKYLTFLGPDGIYVAAADGSIKPRRLLEIDSMAENISPDGHTMALVREGKNTMRDIWLVPLQGEGETLTAGIPQPFLNGPADEINPAFSPDGKWLAYSSSQNGVFTIYVCSLKRAGLNWQVSTEEGFLPEWSPRGKELIFHPLQHDGLWLASYAVHGDTFVPGPVTSRPVARVPFFPSLQKATAWQHCSM